MTNEELLKEVKKEIATGSESLRVDVKKEIDRLDSKIGQLDSKVEQLDSKIGHLDSKIDNVKHDLHEEIISVKLDLSEQINYNMKVIKSVDAEVKEFRGEYNAMNRSRMDDGDAIIDDFIELKKRVKKFEKQLKTMNKKPVPAVA
jgi:chromosome segregation ATPase